MRSYWIKKIVAETTFEYKGWSTNPLGVYYIFQNLTTEVHVYKTDYGFDIYNEGLGTIGMNTSQEVLEELKQF